MLCDWTNIDILRSSSSSLLNNVNILEKSNNVNIVPGDPISQHQYECLLAGDHPEVLSQCHIMSYHMTHVMSPSYHSNEAPIKVTYYPQEQGC